MALVTHTPGPWTVERIPDEAKRDPELTMDADGAFWIAEACMAGGEVLAIVTALPKDADAAEANARLMALAPDLLACCRRFLEMYDGIRENLGPSVRAACERTDAVVAKAEGR